MPRGGAAVASPRSSAQTPDDAVHVSGLRPVHGTDRSTAVESTLAVTTRLPARVRVTLEYRNPQADGFTFADDRRRARHLALLSVRMLGD